MPALEIGFDLFHYRIAEFKLLRHGSVTFHHRPELAVGIFPLDRHLGQIDQKIRHLRILGIALAGSGNYHYSSRGIGENDIDNLVELLCIGERRSAEFANFHIFLSFLLRIFRRLYQNLILPWNTE